ncbi:MAG TPA: hypothetical protein VGQ99_22620 [Tepidisphaeraceae bacterium]|nr:hypothetical protein [Tepidisphaeraceae bacterium]
MVKEADAVQQLLALVESGSLKLATSATLSAEIDASVDVDRRQAVRSMLSRASVDLDPNAGPGDADFEWIRGLGIRTADALHILNARAGGAFFITTDDGILRKAAVIRKRLSVRILSPVQALSEVI